jgi:carboxyl-terminal processing protease
MTEQAAGGAVTAHHGGTFTLEGGTYSETVVWAAANTRGLIGKTNRFRISIDGDICTITGLNNPWSGKWTRVKSGENTAPQLQTPADPAARRKADIEFLLTEFKKQAGRLIEVKGIDWNEVSAWCRTEAEKVQSDEDHLRLCQQLLARLRDGHAKLEGARVTFPDDSAGRPWTPAPVQLVSGSEGVLVMAASDEAAAAGAVMGALVTHIEDKPAHEWLEAKVDEWTDKICYSTRHHALFNAARYGLGGWEGTTVRISVKAPEGEKPVELKRRKGNEAKPFAPEKQLPALKTLGRQSYGLTAAGFGYIHLGNTPGDLPQQLDTMLESLGDVPGMILDMRGNSGGGCDHREVFGRFLKKGEFWGSYEGMGARPFAGPMVVILDAGCASAGETVGGQFGEDQRAYMIGATPTAGMSSQKTRIPAPSGLFTAYISIYSNKGRFNKGRGIEGIGVPPHEIVSWQASDLAAGLDTQIRRAEEILKSGIPSGAIDYVPPSP